MQYNGETNALDLFSDARAWCGIADTDTTTFTLKEFTRSANFALDRALALILKADGKWQFDDTVQTSEILDVSNNLVANTQKYAISVTWLKIGRVRVKDSAGNWITLSPTDRRDLSDPELTATAGTPAKYELLGNWLYLYPKPSYASTGGLEVQFQRAMSYFATTDTTKTPGFATQFHRLCSLHPALDYCEMNSLDKRAQAIRAKIGSPPTEASTGSGMEKDLVDFYSSRNADQKVSLELSQSDYGASELGGDGLLSGHPDRY